MGIRRALTALTLTAALCQPSYAQPATNPPAVEIARSLQQKYDSVRDFTADFVQTYEAGVLRRKRVERGTVLIKKPGRMRWNYTSPEKKTFVSDGQKIYLHVPADKQVMVSPVPAEDQATSAVLFLMGKGNLTRDFTVTHGAGATASTYVLRLEPKIRQAEYDWLQLTVDRSTLQILALTAGDMQGGTSAFQFSNLKENVGLSDKSFAFSIPRGTEVISSGTTR